MKPYAHRDQTWDQRIFNYRLSRARRIVENAFGILAQRFGCLLGTMRQAPETVAVIMRAAVCLHNLLRIRCPRISPGIIDCEDANQPQRASWLLEKDCKHGRNGPTYEGVSRWKVSPKVPQQSSGLSSMAKQKDWKTTWFLEDAAHPKNCLCFV